MDKKIVGVVGVISGLASFDGAQAATEALPNTSELPAARSYAELLDPIPNALALLMAADAAQASAELVDPQAQSPNVKLAQYHHHHHHHYRHYHHHHHHHYYHHHHHHHHHHHYY
jgi:hypothetical protein